MAKLFLYYKIAKLYEISKLISVSILIGNPPQEIIQLSSNNAYSLNDTLTPF